MRLFSNKIDLYKPTMFFIGVSTHNSFINTVFYDWIKVLNIDAELIGVNLDINCTSNDYRKTVLSIKSNPLVLGSLVTTHKVRLYNSTKHLFDYLPETCNEFEEIGCIYKSESLLCGAVPDLVSSSAALYSFLPTNYFKTSLADFCILGGGGAGLALAYRVLTDKNPKPTKLILTDVSKNRLDTIKSVLEKYDTNNILELHFIKGNEADYIIESLRKGSVIINATGLGKDREGAPFSQNTNIPKESFLWDFNYRGKLDFLKIAHEQSEEKNLQIFDGWIYFIHGWTQVMSKVFSVENIAVYFEEFLAIANSKR